MQVYFDSADATGLLEFSEVKFWSEESFGLPKNCPYDVGFFYDPFKFKSCVDNILYSECLGCSRKLDLLYIW